MKRPPPDALRRSAGVLLDHASTDWGQAVARWLDELATAIETEHPRAGHLGTPALDVDDLARVLVEVTAYTDRGQHHEVVARYQLDATFRAGVHALARMLPAMVAGLADESHAHADRMAEQARRLAIRAGAPASGVAGPLTPPPPGYVEVWSPHPDGRPRYLLNRSADAPDGGRPVILRHSDGSTSVPAGYTGQLPPAYEDVYLGVVERPTPPPPFGQDGGPALATPGRPTVAELLAMPEHERTRYPVPWEELLEHSRELAEDAGWRPVDDRPGNPDAG